MLSSAVLFTTENNRGMGIHAEMVSLVAQLRSRRALVGDTVVEIGAQAVCAASEAIAAILEAAWVQ